MLDPAVLWLPERARALPEGSLERAYASLGLRQLWHLVYDPCPALPEAHFEPFMAYVHAREVSLEWTFHVALRAWLEAPSAELVQELLAAAASRWTLSDRTADRGIMLVDPGLPGRAIVGWKSKSLAEGKRVVAVAIEGQPAWPDAPHHALLDPTLDLAEAVARAWPTLRRIL